jgi:hypothetical protein
MNHLLHFLGRNRKHHRLQFHPQVRLATGSSSHGTGAFSQAFDHVGVAAFTVPLIRGGAPWRGPAVVFALGALLVLVEIVSAQVVFSQVGNILIAIASATFAWRLLDGGALRRGAGALAASAS